MSHRFCAFIKRIYKVSQRLRNVIFANLDYRKVLKRYDSPYTLFYLAPPYLVRRCRYRFTSAWREKAFIKLYRLDGVTDPERAALTIIKTLPKGAHLCIEDLQGLYKRFKKVRQNYLPYGKLQTILKDLAPQAGITIITVKPHYTSVTCPRCRNISRVQRAGATFKCLRCGFIADADIVGAWNVGIRGYRGLAHLDKVANTRGRGTL